MPVRILNKRYHLLGHIIFWSSSIIFLCILFFLYSRNFNISLLTKSLIINAGFALAVYTNLYLLIPRFLKKKNYIFFIFWLVLLITATSFLVQVIIVFLLRNVLDVSPQFQSLNSDTHSAFFFATFLYVAISSFLKFIKDWFSLQDLNYRLARIEKEKLEAELKTLKGQLNPHFLFNSLNNIYSLALIKSEKVPDLILKLSDLMRHIIYESRENYIRLLKEIEFVDNFIALQKIRTSDTTRIKYSKTGEIPDARIAPLLFEPFIDNAFKHGLPGNDEDDYIAISFDFSSKEQLSFSIKNNYEENKHLDTANSGIGISNVKERLKHLYKKNEYTLNVNKEDGIFSIELELQLK